jgi:hypothetical protein
MSDVRINMQLNPLSAARAAATIIMLVLPL